MKFLFWLGAIVLVLGFASLIVPVRHNEREGFKAGGISLGIETRHDEKVSPIVSAALILGGAGMMAAGKLKQ
jgi:hypothetical protein